MYIIASNNGAISLNNIHKKSNNSPMLFETIEKASEFYSDVIVKNLKHKNHNIIHIPSMRIVNNMTLKPLSVTEGIYSIKIKNVDGEFYILMKLSDTIIFNQRIILDDIFSLSRSYPMDNVFNALENKHYSYVEEKPLTLKEKISKRIVSRYEKTTLFKITNKIGKVYEKVKNF